MQKKQIVYDVFLKQRNRVFWLGVGWDKAITQNGAGDGVVHIRIGFHCLFDRLLVDRQHLFNRIVLASNALWVLRRNLSFVCNGCTAQTGFRFFRLFGLFGLFGFFRCVTFCPLQLTLLRLLKDLLRSLSATECSFDRSKQALHPFKDGRQHARRSALDIKGAKCISNGFFYERRLSVRI